MNFNVSLEFALRCIIFQQMRQHLGIGQVIDRYDFDSFHVLNAAESQAANTSKSVNTYFYSH
ncbi:hypothetical protein D3C71_1654150 [compost metagenome]